MIQFAANACYGKLLMRLDFNVQGGHSPGKPEKPGKVREFQSGHGKVRENAKSRGKVRVTEICLLDFERAEELKLQLLAACGLGLWICSSLTLL